MVIELNILFWLHAKKRFSIKKLTFVDDIALDSFRFVKDYKTEHDHQTTFKLRLMLTSVYSLKF